MKLGFFLLIFTGAVYFCVSAQESAFFYHVQRSRNLYSASFSPDGRHVAFPADELILILYADKPFFWDEETFDEIIIIVMYGC